MAVDCEGVSFYFICFTDNTDVLFCCINRPMRFSNMGSVTSMSDINAEQLLMM